MLQKLVFYSRRTLTLLSSEVINPPLPAKTTLPSRMSETKVFRRVRYDGRSKKRQWEERRSDKGEGLNPSTPKQQKVIKEKPEEIIDRVKRRKFAFLLGYSGTGYFGMQRNPNTKTIEEDLFKALKQVELIDDDSFNQVQNMQFQRAARTDKGVSAARQVVSMKLKENIDLLKINAELPEVIRAFGYKRVTKGFNSKSQCDSRTYIYIIPTVSFANQNDNISQKDYRMSDDIHKKVNEVLQSYVGTKNFHNFTSKKKPNDPSAIRYIKSFVCENPFIRNNVEFATLKVHGQSFMLHQIRKMVGLMLAIVRGLAAIDILNTAFTSEKVNVPRAPGLGLVLDYVHYDRYNNRYGADGMHEKLTWEEAENAVNDFKEKHIFPTIINTEINDESMVYWLQNKLSRHSYTDIDEKNESDDEDDKDDEDPVSDNGFKEKDEQLKETSEKEVDNKSIINQV